MHTTHSNTQYKNESSTVKWAQWDKTQSRELLVCSYVCASHCAIVAHNIAQNRLDSFPPYPPDNHHCSDDVYLREGGAAILQECHSKTAQVHLQKIFLPLLISDVQQLYTRQHQKQQFLKATKDNRISATRVHDSGRLNTTCCFYHNQPVCNDITVNK